MGRRCYRELEVLDFIEQYEARHAQPPTVREIAEGMNLASPNAVYKYLTRLRNEGRLQWEPRRHRGLRLVAQPAKRRTRAAR
jgi:SOS-response transcriptional repressor LexA